MDALKIRVGAFTEGVLTMVCPVLLAVALNKISSNNVGTGSVGDAIYLAIFNLTLCLFALVFLVITNMLNPRNHQFLQGSLYFRSKQLVHVCVIIQSFLAYKLVHIKMNKQSTAPLVMFVCIFTVLWWILSVGTGQQQDNECYEGFHDRLAQLLETTASLTSFLFQMLVALALQSQASNSRTPSGSLGLTFLCCSIGTCLMLAGTVVYPIENDAQRQDNCRTLCMVFHWLCLGLILTLTVVLMMLVAELCRLLVFTMVIVPWLSVGVVFLIYVVKTEDGDDSVNDQAKPAPLGLTKAMFAGFLAVWIPTFSSGTVSLSTKVFIATTAGVVISGLLWRLLTHLAPMRAAVVAADVACLITQLYVWIAAFSFVLVANDALAKGNIACQTPCTSGQQIQDSILTCINKTRAEFQGKNWTSVLSSVSC